MSSDLTRHASRRCQQRGIPPLVIDLLRQVGASEQVGHGASRLYFDKPARRRVAAYAGPLAALLDAHLDVYAIVGDDDSVITAAHRLERMRRR